MQKSLKQQLHKIYEQKLLDSIIKDYINNMSLTDLLNKYNTSKSTLERNLLLNNIPLRSKYKHSKISKRAIIQNNIFENLNNPDTQYWLGFLSADGSIFENRISLFLALKDKDVIEKFNTYLGNKLKIHHKLHHKKFQQVGVSFRNTEIVNFLKNIGITTNKSFTIDYKENITWNYLRGLIDGDGCISITDKRRRIELVSASELLINKVGKFLKNNSIDFKIYKINNKNILYSLQIHKQSSVLNLIENLYNNAHTYMNRKYENAVKIRNYLYNKRLNSGN